MNKRLLTCALVLICVLFVCPVFASGSAGSLPDLSIKCSSGFMSGQGDQAAYETSFPLSVSYEKKWVGNLAYGMGYSHISRKLCNEDTTFTIHAISFPIIYYPDYGPKKTNFYVGGKVNSFYISMSNPILDSIPGLIINVQQNINVEPVIGCLVPISDKNYLDVYVSYQYRKYNIDLLYLSNSGTLTMDDNALIIGAGMKFDLG
ncbi:MAG: hypothetical protein ABIH39_01615 [Candidatus Margulisiibacteriota bacterium]